MKLKRMIKDKVTEAAFQVYDLKKKDVIISLDRMGTKQAVKNARSTKHTIKWHSKVH